MSACRREPVSSQRSITRDTRPDFDSSNRARRLDNTSHDPKNDRRETDPSVLARRLPRTCRYKNRALQPAQSVPISHPGEPKRRTPRAAICMKREPDLPAVSKPCVLVADDDPLIVATLGHVLRAAEFEVAEVFDSASALEAYIRLTLALAIIDYAMPGSNGVELARLITTRTSVPVMFLSAYSDAAIVREAIAAGAMTYLIKPIDTLQILPAVRTALERSRDLQALRFQTGQLNSALQSGRNVSVATGLLMAKFRIGQKEALERLRRHARSSRTRLETLATELLRATDEAGKLYESLGRYVSERTPRQSDDDA